MKPGRELNALVAEKVFGVPKTELVGYGYRVRVSDGGSGYTQTDLPRYSEDIAAAWEVVEKLWGMSEGGEVSIRAAYDGTYIVEVTFHGTRTGYALEIADTAPHAICLAALRALGVNP